MRGLNHTPPESVVNYTCLGRTGARMRVFDRPKVDDNFASPVKSATTTRRAADENTTLYTREFKATEKLFRASRAIQALFTTEFRIQFPSHFDCVLNPFRPREYTCKYYFDSASFNWKYNKLRYARKFSSWTCTLKEMWVCAKKFISNCATVS